MHVPRAVFMTVMLLSSACEAPVPTEPVGLESSSAQLLAHRAGNAPGRIVVFHSARAGNPSKIFAMRADGNGQVALTTGPGADIWPDISRDGRFVTFASNRTTNNEIYVLDLADGSLVNVSNHTGDDNWPRFSPNGRRIAFHSNRDGNYNIYTVNVDGTDLRRVTSDAVLDQWPDWSPNGKLLAFRRGMDVYVADADGEERNVRALTFSPAVLDQMPVWSPNGKEIAFMSVRDGYPSVFLMSARGETAEHPAVNLTPKDAAHPASAWLSRAPAWSTNGRRIYFMSFRPSTGGDVEIFVMKRDGRDPTRLTNSAGEDGGPRMR